MDINEIKGLSRAELVAEHRAAIRRAGVAMGVGDNDAATEQMDRVEIIDAELTERDMAGASARTATSIPPP